jgi:hypothetical protein
MPMQRYRPAGWRGESHRHYLARYGVKTASQVKYKHSIDVVQHQKYYAEKDDVAGRTADVLKSLVSDDKPETDDFAKRHRDDNIDSEYEKYKRLGQEEIAKGDLTDDDAQGFFGGPFKEVVQDYEGGDIDHKRFTDRMKSEWDRWMQVHRKTVKLL